MHAGPYPGGGGGGGSVRLVEGVGQTRSGDAIKGVHGGMALPHLKMYNLPLPHLTKGHGTGTPLPHLN